MFRGMKIWMTTDFLVETMQASGQLSRGFTEKGEESPSTLNDICI
jgi:hypothetical protein